MVDLPIFVYAVITLLMTYMLWQWWQQRQELLRSSSMGKVKNRSLKISTTVTICEGIQLAPEEVNRYKNVFAVQVLLSEVFRFVLKWECKDKVYSQSYAEYLEQENQKVSNVPCGLWKKLLKNKLSMSSLSGDLSTFDVTLLFEVLLALFTFRSEQRKACGDTERNDFKLLQLLRSAKDSRNVVMHRVADASMDPILFDEIVMEMHEIINEVGIVYNISTSETDHLKTQLETMLKDVRTEEEKKNAYCLFSLLTYGLKYAKLFWKIRLSEETLLFSDDTVNRAEVFFNLDLMVRKVGARPDDVIHCRQLLDCDKKFVIVSGVAGSGKTTLLKNMILQFYGLSSFDMDGIKEFNVLVYHECRRRTIENLCQLIEQNFEKVCFKINSSQVLKGIASLKTLFLVDGYDEAHSHFTEILEQLINKMRTDYQVVITTRPNAASELKTILKREEVDYQEFEIAEISQFDDQKIFLEKYENALKTPTHSVGFVDCFSSLDQSIRDLFVHPIYLVLFCHLVSHFPDRIAHWQSHSEVAQDIFYLYKTLIESKLATHKIHNKDGLIDDFFKVIGDLSLKSIPRNEVVFTEKQYCYFKKLCRKTLKDYHALDKLDSNAVLGVVMKLKRPLSKQDCYSYSFHHKSIQELFASKPLSEELRSGVGSLKQILLTVTRELRKLLGVLSFVFMELSHTSERELFQSCWQDLKETVTAAGADRQFWQKLMLSCPGVQQITEHAASLSVEVNTWTIASSRDTDVAARMLPYGQPSTLSVRLPVENEVPCSWSNITRLFMKRLELHLMNPYSPFDPCDGLLTPLLGAGCELAVFEGSIDSPASVSALASIANATTNFFILMETPLDLGQLQDKHCELWVTVKASVVTDRCALPVSSRLGLRVEDLSSGNEEALLSTVLALAPADKRFHKLEVRQCDLTDGELMWALTRLHSIGCRTPRYSGKSRVHKIGDHDYLLILTDANPLEFQSGGALSSSSNQPPLLPASDHPVLRPLPLHLPPSTSNSQGPPDKERLEDRVMMVFLDVMPRVMRLILAWECPDKTPEETYKMYIEKRNGGPLSRGQWRRMGHWSNVLQRERNSDNFDITLLYSLLSCLFEMNISQDGGKKTNLKTLLNTAKKFRNEVMHSVRAFTRQTYRDVPSLVFDLLEEAAQVYSLSSYEELKTIENVKTRLNEFDDDDIEREDEMLAMKLLMEETSNRTWQRSLIERHIPLFVSPLVQDQASVSELSSPHKLLENDKKVVIVIGKAASGKSTLLKSIEAQFLEPGASAVAPWKNLDIVVYCACRNSASSFAEVMKQNFPGVCDRVGVEMAERCLLKLRTLFLIDGYDEASSQLSVVLEELFYKVKNSECKMIVTTRPCASSSLRLYFNREDLSFEEFQIVPVVSRDDQIAFLQQCEKSSSSAKSPGNVIENFSRLKKGVQEFLKEPLLLASFSHICESLPEGDRQCSTVFNFIEVCHFMYLKTILQETSSIQLDNPSKLLVEQSFAVLSHLAFSLCAEKKLSFGYEKFVEFFMQRDSRNERFGSPSSLAVGVEKVVKSFLSNVTVVRNDYSADDLRICCSFRHSAFLHFYAARAVVTALSKSPVPSLAEVFSTSECWEVDGLQGRSALYHRFADVLPYVAFELSAPENTALQRACWPELKEALTEVGTDAEGWRELLDARPDNELLASEVASMSA